MHHRVLALASLLAALPTPPRAEEIPAAQAEIVHIDVVVTDGNGKLVRTLQKEDFEVFDDGKRQEISNFFYAGQPEPKAGAAMAEPPPTAAPLRDPADAPITRNVLILVDDLHIALDGLDSTKRALRRVVDEFITAEDQVALVTTSPVGVLQPFTRNRDEVRNTIARLSVQRAASPVMTTGAQITPVQAEMILAGNRQAVELAGRVMVADPGGMYDNSLQAAVMAGPNAGPMEIAEGKQKVAELEARRQARAILEQALMYSVASLRAIDEALRTLSRLPGRKLCLLISEGFLLGTGTTSERLGELQRVIDAATRSGTVIYTLDSRGLATGVRDASALGSSAVEPGLQGSVDRQGEQIFRTTLQTVAEDTGGFIVKDTNDFTSGLRRMLEDNAAYYMVAWQPTAAKRDGKFHRIEVKLPRRSGHTARTKRGYYAPDDKKRARPTSLARSPFGTDARAILEAADVTGAAPLRVTADFVDLPPAGSQAILRTHLDLARLPWTKEAGRHRATVEIIGGLYDSAGKPYGPPFSKRSELDLTPEEWKRAKDDGIRYQQALPLPPGRYHARVVARDAQGTRVAGGSTWIEIPDIRQKLLTLSSVFLSSSVPKPTGVAEASGESEADLRDAQSSRRFKAGEDVYFQVYVYNPARDAGGAHDAVLQAQLRSADKVVAASKPQPVTLQERNGVLLPETNGMSLAGLPAGRYELRIVVFDKKANASAHRNIDFTLE
jgi:VWFA-related protein